MIEIIIQSITDPVGLEFVVDKPKKLQVKPHCIRLFHPKFMKCSTAYEAGKIIETQMISKSQNGYAPTGATKGQPDQHVFLGKRWLSAKRQADQSKTAIQDLFLDHEAC